MSILTRVFLLLFMLSIPRLAVAYQTENVFLVIIDGIRSSEAFDDPTHQYIPRMWNDLRPQGSIIMGIDTLVDTSTMPGHFSIVSGVWDDVIMDFNSNQRFRPNNPTFFEYYRKQLNIPADKTFFVAFAEHEKATTNRVTYSLHPLYGENYGATLKTAIQTSGLPDDGRTWATLQDVMDTYHPSLTFINFKAVDIAGHLGDWDNYLTAIKTADQIIYDLWEKIQSDPVYANKTTLIVTSDHGRHEDSHGGFDNHGVMMDDGCRILPLLALGPDFAVGRQLDVRRSLIDVAPTIAELLGFDMPLAQGRVMYELFSNPPTANSSFPSNPKITVSNATKHLARTVTPPTVMGGNEQIFSFRGEVGTSSWSLPRQISNNIIANASNISSASDGVIHSVYNGWFPTDGSYTNNEDWQYVYHTYSTDQGSSWSEPTKINSFFVRKGTPNIEVDGDFVMAAWSALVQVSIARSLDGGVTWDAAVKEIPGLHASATPRFAIDGSKIYLVVHAVQDLHADGNRDIFYSSSVNAGSNWNDPVRLTSDPSNQMNPDIALGNGTQHLVWQNDRSGQWQVSYQQSSDGGATWTQTTNLSRSIVGAWQPRVVVSNDNVLVAWVDYRDGNSNIYYRKSNDGGATWTAETRLLPAGGFSEHFDLTIDGGKVYFVWDDDRSGQWSVLSAEVDITANILK